MRRVTPIKLSLLENAESFVAESISKAIAAEQDPRQWKFAILAAVQAIELILKEILRREHWTLVFQNIDKPKLTVSLDQAMERLRNIARVEFSKSDAATLASAVSLRNQVVHAEVSFEPNQVKAIVARLIQFAAHLFSTFLQKQLHEALDAHLWLNATQLGALADELRATARARILQESVDAKYLMDCWQCYGEGVFVASHESYMATCYVCGNTDVTEWCVVCGHAVPSVEAISVFDDDADVWACNGCGTDADKMNRFYMAREEKWLAKHLTRPAERACGE